MKKEGQKTARTERGEGERERGREREREETERGKRAAAAFRFCSPLLEEKEPLLCVCVPSIV